MSVSDALENPARDVDRIVLPPVSYLHEREKVEQRRPAATRFIVENKLNEWFEGNAEKIGIVLQGGMYNGVIRALQRLAWLARVVNPTCRFT